MSAARFASPDFGGERKSRRFRVRALVLVFLCAGFAGRARAQSTFVGVRLDFPASVQDVGSDRPGRGAGVTLTHMNNAFVGYGAEVSYHDWPASTAYRERFDQYLRSSRFETIDGTQWGFSALQMTAHVRFAAPARLRLTPWVQVGAGVYRLDLNLDERKHADTYAWVEGPEVSQRSWFVAGGYGEVGLDVPVFSRVALGMEATFHDVLAQRKGEGLFGSSRLPDFHALTFGTHLQYGW